MFLYAHHRLCVTKSKCPNQETIISQHQKDLHQEINTPEKPLPQELQISPSESVPEVLLISIKDVKNKFPCVK